MLSAIIGALFLFADQLIKFWTVSHIELNTGIRDLFPGIVHLTYIKNYGAAFGLFSNASWLRWLLLGLLVCFTLFILLGVRRGGYLRTGFARFTGIMLLAGLLGNGIDRAIYGYVVDMFELEFINFAIFNLADMLVVVFGILFCIALVSGGIGAAEKDEDEELVYSRRRSSQEDRQPQRAHRSHPEGQTHRTSRSGGSQSQRSRTDGESQRARRPRTEEEPQRARRPRTEEEPQRARRPRTEEEPQRARRPRTEEEPQRARRPRTEEEPQRARRPRPTEFGMSTRPVVLTPDAAENPVTPADPTAETPAESAAPEADATRTFQPVGQSAEVPEEPKAEPDATRTFQPVGQSAEVPEESKAEPGATRTFQPVNQPAPAPAAKTAAKAADEFDLDAIMAEFK